MSSETPDVETHLFVKNKISKYQLFIDITSKPLKNKMIEIDTTLKFNDKELSEKKSNFEIVYTTIVKLSDEIETKKDLEKIILCDVQNEIFPNLKKTFLNLLHDSGYTEVKLEKKIDFEKLYSDKLS